MLPFGNRDLEQSGHRMGLMEVGMGRYRLPLRFQPIALFIRLRMLRASSADENIQFHLKKGYKQRSLSIEKNQNVAVSVQMSVQEN